MGGDVWWTCDVACEGGRVIGGSAGNAVHCVSVALESNVLTGCTAVVFMVGLRGTTLVATSISCDESGRLWDVRACGSAIVGGTGTST